MVELLLKVKMCISNLYSLFLPSACSCSFFPQGLALSNEQGIRLLTDLIREELGIPCAVIMGANLASEVSQENYCEATIGAKDLTIGRELKMLFQVRIYLFPLSYCLACP